MGLYSFAEAVEDESSRSCAVLCAHGAHAAVLVAGPPRQPVAVLLLVGAEAARVHEALEDLGIHKFAGSRCDSHAAPAAQEGVGV